VSNKEVLQRANASRNLLKVIVNRQVRFLGHIMRESVGSDRIDWDDQRQKQIEVDKGKRLWTGYHSLVGNDGRSTTY